MHSTRITAWLLGSVVGLHAQTAAAQPTAAGDGPPEVPAKAVEPDGQPSDLARLREMVEAQARAQRELEARVARQEAALAEEREKRAHEAEPRTRLRGYVHLDWTMFRQSSQDEVSPDGEPLNEDRFVVRRARLGAETDQGLVYGTILVDANTIRGPQVRPWATEVALKWPETTKFAGPAKIAERASNGPFVIVSAGLIMTPFGYETPELESTRPFLERSTFANALFPQSYDLGVRVLGGYKVLNWALGIMNGDPIGEKTFPGRDPNTSKDLSFRLGAAAPVVDQVRIAAGFSGLTGRGFHQGNPETKDQLVWRDENEDGLVGPTELRSVPGSPASPSAGFQRFALGADARMEIDLPILGTLAARVELVRAKNLDRGLSVADPIASSRDLRELGWTVAATQEITKWALVGVRHDRYDPDSDASEQQPFAVVPRDASFSTTSFMATLRYKTAKLVAQYDLRKNALGRDASGAPTTLADDSFTLRAAVGF